MSHFTVLILGDDLEGQLAPYDENESVDPYRSYEDGEPKDFWAVASLREAGLITVPDDQLTWRMVQEAHLKRYGEDEDGDGYLLDTDGRMYRMSTYNPKSKWDYWRIGGRWAGYFLYKPGHEGQGLSPELSWEWKDADAAERMEAMRRTDQALKEHIDIDGMRQEYGDKAAETWDKYYELVEGTPDIVPWDEYRSQVEAGTLTIEEARDKYHDQARIRRVNEARATNRDYFFNHEEMQAPRDLYIERARAGALPGYATLVNGEWYEPGRMGWWAMTTATTETTDDYRKLVNQFIDDASDDTLFSVVDCHI